MPLSSEKKVELISKHGRNEKDTGSPESQIAMLTQRIRDLTEHVNIHKKDRHTRRGLVLLVAKRRKLMKYLRRTNPQSYVKILDDLSIRGYK
ncbi:MAG: 30S ribosomal protein S15 [Candidatus Marinimicrobia bacterium]|nr:30S ribosomal protein S15 [Candidatus Neomarinimicrobiota bacterium]